LKNIHWHLLTLDMLFARICKRFHMPNLNNRPPTIADVAKKADVSIATVSRVINASTPVNPETAERVRDAIKGLNYFPSPAARILASRRTNTIGLILPEISGAFFPPMLKGIEAGVREAGFDLLIHTTQSIEGITPRHRLGEHNTDGLLVFIGSVDDGELIRLRQLNFPVVLLHQTPPAGLKIPMVTVENKSGAQKLVEHLIELHHCRRIAFLQGPDGHADSVWRERGYREALRNHRIPFDPTLVGKGEFNHDSARAAVQAWLLDGIEFDAIFAGDDEAASGAMQALLEYGKRIPDDLAVVGFDDISFSKYLNPPLTTVRAPTERVGSESVRQLVSLIRKGHAEAEVLLPTEMVIRRSCGCEFEK
jgi:LacI family transcriptional regulator